MDRADAAGVGIIQGASSKERQHEGDGEAQRGHEPGQPAAALVRLGHHGVGEHREVHSGENSTPSRVQILRS